MSNVQAYIGLENTTFSKGVITEEKKEHVTFEAVLQEGDVKNRNNKTYLSDVLWQSSQDPMIQEQLKRQTWYGEANHPIEQTVARQLYIDFNNVSHTILSYERRGNLFYAKVRTAPEGPGAKMRGLVLQGSEVAFSFRGLIEVDKKRSTNDNRIVIKAKMVTYDWVNFPAHVKAYQQRILANESFKDIQLTSALINQIACESSDVFNMVHDFLQADPVESVSTFNGKSITSKLATGETLYLRPEAKAFKLLSDL